MFAAHGITHIHRVLTDNAKNYRISHAFQQACADLGTRQKFTRPHCPLDQRQIRTLQPHPGHRMGLPPPYTSNQQRTQALDSWLKHYNTARPHSALGGQPPASRLTPRS
ncbi:integrase core domain-containing protein [Nonomuraea thailandensis]